MSAVLDPRTIEREISRIRERESNPYSSGVKTNLFTLVIFRTGRAAGPGDLLEPVLQYMLGKRPARIITIDQAAAPQTDVTVSGRCFPDRRNRGVCFEEVHIEAGDDGVGRDPGAWAPLLIRDLPVFAWLPDGLGESDDAWRATILEAASLIDKLIVDTSRVPPANGDLLGQMRGLTALREQAGGSFFISDFSWRRSRVLRELSARAFDQPETRGLLSSIRSVSLDGGSAPDGMLFYLWLSARLTWTPASSAQNGSFSRYPLGPAPGSALPAFRDRGGRDVAFTHAPGGPLAEGFRIRFLFDDAPEMIIGCTKGGCVSNGTERGAYKFPSDGEILLEEVDSLSRDPVYQQALERAGLAGG